MKKFLVFLNIFAVYLIFKSSLILAFSETTKNFKFRALDVGQGDAFFIEIPETSIQILIDSGPSSRGVSERLKEIMPVQDDLIDIVILTHAHDDHLGGLLELMDNYEIGLFIETGAKTDNESYALIKEKIDFNQIVNLYAARGEKIKIGNDFNLEILHPFFSKKAEYKNLNNSSIVAKINYKNQSFLLTGDLEQEGEKELISYLIKREDLYLAKADVLKIAHHGSETSSSNQFLELVKPKKAIISVGSQNQFNHPSLKTIERLEENQIEVLRTDRDGEVVLLTPLKGP
jgi:competence protein ComEC